MYGAIGLRAGVALYEVPFVMLNIKGDSFMYHGPTVSKGAHVLDRYIHDPHTCLCLTIPSDFCMKDGLRKRFFRYRIESWLNDNHANLKHLNKGNPYCLIKHGKVSFALLNLFDGYDLKSLKNGFKAVRNALELEDGIERLIVPVDVNVDYKVISRLLKQVFDNFRDILIITCPIEKDLAVSGGITIHD